MNGLLNFLGTSYTAYQAVENAETLLKSMGFVRLNEHGDWNLKRGGKYYVVRGGSGLIAFTAGKGLSFKIVASHTDSPCFKLKDNPVTAADGMYKLNVEPYGGGIYYSFFDRSLRLAGRIVREQDGAIKSEPFVSDYRLVVPSLAIHMNREVNSGFAPNPQVDLLPLYSVECAELDLGENAVSYDLFLTPDEAPFYSGANGELVSSPRADNLTSVYSSLTALSDGGNDGICICACLDNEEVGSRTLQGAGSDFLRTTMTRIARALGYSDEEFAKAIPSSFLLSLDNAHAVHPNHPEKCDPTNRAKLGGGVVIKSHADKAYTTDGLTAAVVKTIFKNAGVKYQNFYNRSDMRSGGTLGAISLGQIGIPSCDIGLAQLAMHSAVETFAKSDYLELEKGLKAFFASNLAATENGFEIR